MEKKLRSTDRSKDLLQQHYVQIEEYEPKTKLPNGLYLMGRMLFLLKVPEKGTDARKVTKDIASDIVAHEVCMDWICKNVYPKTERAVAKQILKDYKTLQDMSDYEKKAKKLTENWKGKADSFNLSMTKTAYDICSTDANYTKGLEEAYGVKMNKEDFDFYTDNCKGQYKATCLATIPSKWTKMKQRQDSRKQSEEKKTQISERAETEIIAARKLQYQESLIPDESANNDAEDEPLAFKLDPASTSESSKPYILRSSEAEVEDSVASESVSHYPKVRIRSGPKSLNENVIRCMVQCLSDYKVSNRDLTGIMISTANMIFGQSWTLEPEVTDEMESKVQGQGENIEDATQPPPRKRRKALGGATLDYVFPSRRTIERYLEDAALLNLRYVGQHLLEKQDKVVTVGLDDTTKAAGRKFYDVKTDHITVTSETERKILTTGYVENVSHAGAEGATAYKYKLQTLAILTNSTCDEILEAFDFWMTDRAGDCSTLVEALGITDDKVLKCSAHLILAVDHACDKVFRNVEQKIGIQQLLKLSAGDKVFNSPGSSVHTLGQIAITKLLSPSHAANSVSLYTEYTSWMDDQGIDRAGFKGFKSNRFGRIAETAKQFLKMHEHIMKFFESVVDANANKLVLAVSTYLQSEWFIICSKIYEEIGDLVIFPFMDLLGIDEAKAVRRDDRNWEGIRQFFVNKLPELEKVRDDAVNEDGKKKLLAAVIDEAVESLRRQLSASSFFNAIPGCSSASDLQPDMDKLQKAPLTNLGCEGEFAKLDNRLKVTGGSTSVETLSRKNIVATNKLLIDSSFEDRTEFERLEDWKWARTSEETKAVRDLQKEFLSNIKAAAHLSVLKKEEVKKKRNTRMLKLLEKCKEHEGPLTPQTVDKVDELVTAQLLSEVSYLKATISPNIRMKRRVNIGDNKFKFENLSNAELKSSIRNAIKPEEEMGSDVNDLLLSIL